MTKKLLMLATLLLLGCSEGEKENQDILSIFPENKKLENPEILLKDLALDASGIVMFDSIAVVSCYSSPSLTAHNLKSKVQVKWLHKGKAANEMLHFMGMSKYNDSTLYVSSDPDKVFLYNIRKIINNDFTPINIYKIKHSPFSTSAMLEEGVFVYPAKNPDNKGKTSFCKENLNDNTIAYFGSYPKGDKNLDLIPTHDFSLATTYQARVLANPKKDKIVASYSYGAGFNIIDAKTNSLTNRIIYHYPLYEIIPFYNAFLVKLDKDCVYGLEPIFTTDSSIYFLFSNKTRNANRNIALGLGNWEKYILKYNWDGEPLAKYELEYGAIECSISDDETAIYAVTESSAISDSDSGVFLLKYEM